ncbi:hypothetical protein [Pseudonocardia alni]|uniref:hypothetical protein n=1 Tax=Pseudonocardia alni TaxID=33907 RepID=UPI001AD76F6E|nr:hypothetical protein [Pseudonocardia alni]MBO4237926.1 hypothetical protein [Pseudonocardia alni]
MTYTDRPPGAKPPAGEASPSDGALRRVGALVTALFGVPWALTGATALSAPLPAVVASVAISVTCTIIALRTRPAARRRQLPHRWRARYRTIGVTQGVAITLVVAVAVALSAPGLIAPLVCLVVGLHFLPMARVVDQAEYRLTGAALLVIGLAGLAVLAATGPEAARAVTGIGAALTLWITSCIVACEAYGRRDGAPTTAPVSPSLDDGPSREGPGSLRRGRTHVFAPQRVDVMTTRTTTGSRRIWIGWAAAVGTLPYLVLKLIWLGGGSVGMVSPSAVEGATMVAGNAITVIADVLLVVVVVALTRPWGRRLPAWMLLLTGWAGTGLLVPIALTILPTVVITAVVGGSIGDGSMADWVGPLVYGSFAWQGGMLAIAFFLHARSRWLGAVRVPGLLAQARPLAVGGAVVTIGSAVVHSIAGVTTPLPHLPLAALGLVGTVGVLALAGGRPSRSAIVAGWVGSSAVCCSGLYATLLAVGVPGYPADPGVAGIAQLGGSVGGLLLAVAGLAALAPREGSLPFECRSA